MALYQFENNLCYVSKTYRDYTNNSKIEFIYTLFSMNKNGNFIEKKNSNGLVYQIKHTTFSEDTTQTETLEQRWITEIK